jgi:hypothetical protein
MQIVLFSLGSRLTAYLIMFFTALLCLVGCIKCPKSSADFVGRYEMTRPEGKLHMELLPDGTFSERFEPRNEGEVVSRKGTWKFHADKRRIQFLDYMSINTRFSDGNLPKRLSERLDAWFLYHCKWGKIDIYLDEDQELFQKI